MCHLMKEHIHQDPAKGTEPESGQLSGFSCQFVEKAIGGTC